MFMILADAINKFIQILVYLILARAILSWFVRAPYGNLYKIYNVIIQVTEPMLSPCRKLLSRFGLSGAMDFSPMVAIIGLTVINGILINLIRMLAF